MHRRPSGPLVEGTPPASLGAYGGCSERRAALHSREEHQIMKRLSRRSGWPLVTAIGVVVAAAAVAVPVITHRVRPAAGPPSVTAPPDAVALAQARASGQSVTVDADTSA